MTQLFWFVATVQIVLAVAFAVVVRRSPATRGSALQVRLALGQRKDDWLACGVIWMGILSDELPAGDVLLVLGCMALAWLAQRTAHRVRLLQG